MDPKENQWAMFIHLSQFANLVMPTAGIVLPIVLWQIKKKEMPGLDAHGKAVVNWLISLTIYLAVSFLLAFIVIGIPLLMILGILAIIFPIIGGVKAGNGEVWKYPLSIPFIK